MAEESGNTEIYVKVKLENLTVEGMDDDKDQVVEETEKVVDDVEVKLTTQDKTICKIGRMEVVHTPSPGPLYVAELDGCDMDMVHTLSLGPNDTHLHGSDDKEFMNFGLELLVTWSSLSRVGVTDMQTVAQIRKPGFFIK